MTAPTVAQLLAANTKLTLQLEAQRTVNLALIAERDQAIAELRRTEQTSLLGEPA